MLFLFYYILIVRGKEHKPYFYVFGKLDISTNLDKHSILFVYNHIIFQWTTGSVQSLFVLLEFTSSTTTSILIVFS